MNARPRTEKQKLNDIACSERMRQYHAELKKLKELKVQQETKEETKKEKKPRKPRAKIYNLNKILIKLVFKEILMYIYIV